MGAVRDWFRALSRREQILISIMGGLLAIVIVVYGIIFPLRQALDDASTRYSASLAQATLIEGKVRKLKSPASQSVRFRGTAEALVSQSAEERGFTVEQLVKQNDGRVSLTIPSARSNSLYGWLAELERRGLQPESLTVQPKAGDTLSVQLTLRPAQ